MYTLMDRKEVVSKTGTARSEYRGRHLDGVTSDRITEAQPLLIDSFTRLEVDTFHALWNLHPPDAERTQTVARPKKRTLLSRRDAPTLFPIETTTTRSHAVGDKRIDRVGKVYDFCSPYRRVRFPDNDWEELIVSEMKTGVKEKVEADELNKSTRIIPRGRDGCSLYTTIQKEQRVSCGYKSKPNEGASSKRTAREADMRIKDKVHVELSVNLKIGDNDEQYPMKHTSMHSNLRRNGAQMVTQALPWPRAV